jgi:hypothetical protein
MLEQADGLHVTDEWLCDVAGAHRTTVARWRAEQRVPRAIALLVRVMHHGELELIHAAWRDYRLDRRDGTLWTPAAWPARPSDVDAIQYRLAQVRALELELARLREPMQLPLLAERPRRQHDDEKAEHRGRPPNSDRERDIGRRRLAELRDDAARVVDGDDLSFDADRLEQTGCGVSSVVDRERRRDRGFSDDAQAARSRLELGALRQRC